MENSTLIYKELSYKINSLCFDVHNQIGGGLLEKVYQKALSIALSNARISFEEQVKAPILFHNEIIDYGFIDFLIEKKIVLEIKKDPKFVPANFTQVEKYLNALDISLVLLIHFGYEKVIIRRVINKNHFNKL